VKRLQLEPHEIRDEKESKKDKTMPGMMSGMWIWTVVGVLLIVLLIVVIAKLLRK
jgi:hypothetical protein